MIKLTAVVVGILSDPLLADGLDLQPLSPRESMNRAHVADGFVLELMASEPMVRDPVAIDWGPDGALWVAEMADYPYGMDGKGKAGGRVRRLTDVDGDGRFDRFTVFLDEVNFPTSVMAWRRGVLVTAAPDLFYAEDTDGDGRADRKEVLFTGFIQGNQQLRVNSLRWGLDNWVYAASGGHHAGFGKATAIRTPARDAEVALGSRDFRMQPEEGRLEPRSGPSQFGRVRDDWGNWFGVQNSFPLWHYVVDDHYLSRNPDVPAPDARRQLRLPPNPRVYPRTAQKRFHSFEQSGRFTSACGPTIYRDQLLFPSGDAVHAFTCEPFHNVVQHHLLTRHGISFQGERAESEGELDFYASADRWSRPVMARTGPDGALWIVDMYRYMIEHPDWLPQEARKELEPNYRSGEDFGRIYRIYPAGQKPKPMPALADLRPEQLVSKLADPNGLVRDLTHRLLLERNDLSVVPSLQRMIASHADARARLQALAALDGLRALTEPVLIRALQDVHFAVRLHAVRLAETHAEKLPNLKPAVLALVNDPDAQVRLQLACTLGEWQGDAAGRALAALAKEAPDDGLFQAAVLSSAGPHYQIFVDRLAEDPRYAKALMTMALAEDRRMAGWLDRALPALDDAAPPTLTVLEHAANWIAALEERQRPLPTFLNATSQVLRPVVPRVKRLIDAARTIVADARADADLRAHAVPLLGREPDRRAADTALLRPLLEPRTAWLLHAAALQSLARWNTGEATATLLDAWPQLSPQARVLAMETLLARTQNASRLLEAVRAGQVAAVDLGPAHRQRLLQHPDKTIAAKAEALLQHAGDVERSKVKVIEAFRPALALTGNPERGFAPFQERCSLCHVLRETGTAIGPDLRSLTDRSAESLLIAILDPSRNVEPKYLAYTATLPSGESVHGLVLSETGNSLIMRTLDGTRRELLRAEIRSLTGSRLSFMPDGLEAGMTPQDLADLIAFVRDATAEGQ